MFCKACGSRLLEGAGFCANCGSAVDSPAGDPGDQPTVDRAAADQPTLIQSTEIRPRTDAERALAHVPPPPPIFSPPPPPPAPPGPTDSGGYPPQGPVGYPPQGPVRYPSYTSPATGGYGAAPPPRKSRLGLWLGIAAAIVILLAGAGVAVWQLAFDKNGTDTTTTEVAKSTTTSAKPSTTTSSTSAPTTSTSTSGTSSTTLPRPTGAPGDSLGEWVEMDIPNLPDGVSALAISDQALLVELQVGNGYALYAYMFDTKQSVELPIGASDFYNEDVEGNIAVWWEGDYNAGTGEYSNEHIYTYLLPNGPKVEIAGGGASLYYPQIAGSWVTWMQEEPLADNPGEFWLVHVFGVQIDAKGVPQGDAVELVPQATANVQGDVGWSYSLSSTHLAWENATTIGSFDPGVYIMGLDSRQPRIVEPDVWRPALGGKTLVYTGTGLVTTSVDGGAVTTLDPLGDFATAASTFAAYFRSIDSAGGTTYQIVARGFTGAYEQVLGEQTEAPWLSPFIAASDHHVAFIEGGTARIFEWQGLPTY